LAAHRAFSVIVSAFCNNLDAGFGAQVIGSGCPNTLARNFVKETNRLSKGFSCKATGAATASLVGCDETVFDTGV
jgi:hypothetical protein